ncbi:MAG: universal stress protein [Nitrospirae bacterium]|nr:universal stress protein [Nitrospirota bacterium]
MKILLATDGSEYSEKAAKFLAGFNFSPSDEINILHAINWIPVTTEWEALSYNINEIRDEVVPKILASTADILKPVKAKISTSFKEDYPDKAIVEASEESGVDLIVMGARGMRGIGSYIIGSVTKLVALKSSMPVLIVRPPKKEMTGKLKVLFATDGSVYSDAIGKFLLSMPFPDNTELTVLNVIPTVFEDIPERFAIEINDRIKNIVAASREKELKDSEEIIKKARNDLSCKFAKIEKLTRFGDPSVEIPSAADAANADIIAVGTSGMRGIKGMLGSVSRYIINHSGCSVLIGKK